MPVGSALASAVEGLALPEVSAGLPPPQSSFYPSRLQGSDLLVPELCCLNGARSKNLTTLEGMVDLVAEISRFLVKSYSNPYFPQNIKTTKFYLFFYVLGEKSVCKNAKNKHFV